MIVYNSIHQRVLLSGKKWIPSFTILQLSPIMFVSKSIKFYKAHILANNTQNHSFVS